MLAAFPVPVDCEADPVPVGVDPGLEPPVLLPEGELVEEDPEELDPDPDPGGGRPELLICVHFAAVLVEASPCL